nr:TolC family protein [Cytophagales bacterium]
MKQFKLILLGLLLTQVVSAQTILEQYIKTALVENLPLQQQQFVLDKNMLALREAKSLFFPTVTFMSDYFLAGGGRTIDFPAGDLLNPVYSSLNQLTNGNAFPTLENQRVLLNPDNLYDAKFRTTLPLFNLELDYNQKIKREQVNLQQAEIDLYKRELAKEVKVAYFNYLQSLEAIKIYESALGLVSESNRINASLFENDRINRTVVLRGENEVSKTEALIENAQQNANSARAYFNFLLNRGLEESVVVDSGYYSPATAYSDFEQIFEREELRKLKIATNINMHLVGLSNASRIPRLSTFLDLGSQGFDWQFDSRSRYYFFGLSLQWDLFTAGRNNLKGKQARLDERILVSQTDFAASQIQLQLITANNAYDASVSNYRAAVSTCAASQKYYTDILRLYKEGQALFIELMDAQNQLIQAEQQRNISLFDTYIKAAEVERASASFSLEY